MDLASTISTAEIKILQLGQYIHICEQNGKTVEDKKLWQLKLMMLLDIMLFGFLTEEEANLYTLWFNDQFTLINEITGYVR